MGCAHPPGISPRGKKIPHRGNGTADESARARRLPLDCAIRPRIPNYGETAASFRIGERWSRLRSFTHITAVWGIWSPIARTFGQIRPQERPSSTGRSYATRREGMAFSADTARWPRKAHQLEFSRYNISSRFGARMWISFGPVAI